LALAQKQLNDRDRVLKEASDQMKVKEKEEQAEAANYAHGGEIKSLSLTLVMCVKGIGWG
jgi:hypothetical protein